MYLQLDHDYPELWKLAAVAQRIKGGALGVVPTDSVYAFVCDPENKGATERLYRLKEMDPKKPLSILCRDIAMVSVYTRGFPNTVFRAARRCLPGPYTFILPVTSGFPRHLLGKRREVGVRVPADPVCQALLEDLDRPLLASSVRTVDDRYWTSPAEIDDEFGSRIDFVVDGGERVGAPSTVIDLTGDDPVVLRHGQGDASLFE